MIHTDALQDCRIRGGHGQAGCARASSPTRVPAPRSGFARFRFPPEVIVVAVRRYLRYALSYRDVEELLAERGIGVDHVNLAHNRRAASPFPLHLQEERGVTDVAWWDGQRAYKLRSAAVITVQGRLLVCSVESVDGWFLPGGKVRFGESSVAALRRELREELDVEFDVAVARLVVESVYEDRGVLHQETCFYHWLDWPPGVPVLPEGRVGDHVVTWLPLESLHGHRFVPPEIIPILTGAASDRHLFFDRRRAGAS